MRADEEVTAVCLRRLTPGVQLRGPQSAASGCPFGPAARVSCNAWLDRARPMEQPRRERQSRTAPESARSARAAPTRAAPRLLSNDPTLIRFIEVLTFDRSPIFRSDAFVGLRLM